MAAVGLRLAAPRPFAMPPPPPGAEAVAFPSASGSLLRGWWMAGEPGGGGVVLLHGAWENRLRMLRRAEALRAEGFSVLLFDLQAHGESPGARITFGALEALDARAALAFARFRLGPGERLGAVGASLGGAALLLGPHPPPALEAAVLESVFPDLESAVANRLRARLPSPLAPLATALFRALLPPLLGLDPAALRPLDRVAAFGAPLLLLAGEEDRRTPPREAEALLRAAREPKRLVLFPGAEHVDLERHDPPLYRGEVLPFLRARLRPAPPAG